MNFNDNITRKYLNIILTFSIWLLTGIFIFVFGMVNTYASTYDSLQFSATLFDNLGSNLIATTTDFTNNSYRGKIGTTANSTGGAWGISSPIPLLANHTYSLTIKIDGIYGGNIVSSSKAVIGIGTSLNNAKTSYINNSNVTENYSGYNNNNEVQFAFTPSINGNYLVIPFATNYSGNNQEFWLSNIVIDDLGSSGVSQSTINTSLTNQTNTLNNSINNSTNTITGAIDSMQSDIIENQNNNNQAVIDNNNANTEAIIQNNNAKIDELIKNNMTCNYNLIDINKLKLIFIDPNTGVENTSTSRATTDYIEIEPDITYNFNLNGNDNFHYIYYYLYSDTKTLLRYSSINTVNGTFTINNSSYKYIRLSYSNGKTITLDQAKNEHPFFGSIDICKNKVDETNEQLGNLNDSLNNSDSSGASNSASNFFSNFNTNTYGLTSVITSPLSFIQGLSTKTCSTLSIPLPYVNKNLDLPCMSNIYSQYFGTFFVMYQTITFSIIAYWVCVRIFNLVKDFKNPDHDEIEVFDL